MALNIIIDSLTDLTFYDSVRRLLGGLDEDTLSNETILDPAFFDMSEIELLELVPCLDSEGLLDATDIAKARLAMIYLLAIKLVPTAQANTEYEVKTIDVTWRKSPLKWLELRDSLQDTFNNLLVGLDCSDESDSVLFAVAPSKRAVGERRR